MKEFNVGKLRMVAKPHNVTLLSSNDEFRITKELYEALEEAGKIAWKSLTYQDVSGFGNDYSEYYDKKLDNNGYLSFHSDRLSFERPFGANERFINLIKLSSKRLCLIYEIVWRTTNE